MRILASLLLLAATASAVETDPRGAAIRGEILEVERAIDRRFRSVGDEAPMMMLGNARGVYLSGYGAVFTVQLNLVPTANVSPFRGSYSDEEKRQLNIRKRQRLETLEQKAREILLEESAKLRSLPEEEKVALAVSLFHFAWEDRTQLPGQVVASSTKTALAELRSGSLQVAEARRRVKIEYF